MLDYLVLNIPGIGNRPISECPRWVLDDIMSHSDKEIEEALTGEELVRAVRERIEIEYVARSLEGRL